jgi:hypothetical protein
LIAARRQNGAQRVAGAFLLTMEPHYSTSRVPLPPDSVYLESTTPDAYSTSVSGRDDFEPVLNIVYRRLRYALRPRFPYRDDGPRPQRPTSYVGGTSIIRHVGSDAYGVGIASSTGLLSRRRGGVSRYHVQPIRFSAASSQLSAVLRAIVRWIATQQLRLTGRQRCGRAPSSGDATLKTRQIPISYNSCCVLLMSSKTKRLNWIAAADCPSDGLS